MSVTESWRSSRFRRKTNENRRAQTELQETAMKPGMEVFRKSRKRPDMRERMNAGHEDVLAESAPLTIVGFHKMLPGGHAKKSMAQKASRRVKGSRDRVDFARVVWPVSAL